MNAARFIEEQNGKASAVRLILLLWGVGVLVVWIIASVRSNALHEIPESVVVILGLLIGGKAVQRFGEGGVTLRQDAEGGTPAGR